MAKKDLDLILNKIRKEIDASNNLREEFDTSRHTFSTSVEEVYEEVLKQLRGLIDTLDSPTSTELQRRKESLYTLVESYVEYLHTSFKQYKGAAKIVFSRGSNSRKFTITISAPTSKKSMSVFGVINSIRTRKRGLPDFRDGILEKVFNSNKSDQVSSALYGSYRLDERTGKEIRSGGLLQLGHDKSGSVSLRRKAQLLKQFSYKSNIEKLLVGTRTTKETRAEISLAVNTYASGAASKLLKEFTTTVALKEESAFQNQGDASGERAILRALTKEVRSVLKNVDFFNQRGSSSAMDIVSFRIMDAAVKKGGKSRGKRSLVQDSDSVSKIKIASSTKTSSQKESVGLKVPQAKTSPATNLNRNWLQLLPMINSRLTDIVAKNMNSPRLNFRTGRLAQSAKVVNVEQTPQGLPSFVFDYERDPYDVFDRTLGRSPWNTPQRDPRALVDVSVREIVREMAIGRFFTRRA